jgi:hypothetical protein
MVFCFCCCCLLTCCVCSGQQWSLYSLERRLAKDAHAGRSLDCLRISLAQNCSRAHLQARPRQGQRTAHSHFQQRGELNKQTKEKPLSSNLFLQVIEQNLGRTGIICVEDLVHEIYTVGKHFREANRFLWPFKLNSPNGGFEKKVCIL